MEEDPFFSGIVSAPTEVKTTIAKALVSEVKHKGSEKNSKISKDSDKNTRPRDKKDFDKVKQRKTIKDDKFSKAGKTNQKNKFSDVNSKPEIHEKYEKVKRPPPPHEKRPKWVDPKFRPPSMLNDIAFPKHLKINPNAPPGSFKIFSSKVPDIPVHAELYD